MHHPGASLRVTIIGLNVEPEPTGIAPYTSGIARFLADAGHRVHVVAGLPHYPGWRVAAEYRRGRRRVEEQHGAVRVTRVRHPVPADPTGLGRIAMEAVFALRAARTRTHGGARADVVLVVSPALLSVAAAFRHSRAARAPLGVVPQDLYGRALAEGVVSLGPAGAVAAMAERALLRRADAVVAIHDRFRVALAALGVRPDRITTIRNWSHVAEHEGRQSRAEVRAALGWAPDEVVALHAGNMGRKQDLGVLVEAARLADRSTRPVRLVLLGDGGCRAHLETLGAGIRSLQQLDPVVPDRFRAVLDAADVLVLHERPGVAEMCVPSKLTSYFASGRPVVAGTGPASAATAELRTSGGGVTVPAGDPAALLDAVLRLADDPAGSHAMGLRGRRFAQEVLHVDRARAAYVAWVEGLAAGRAAPEAQPAALHVDDEAVAR